MLHKMKRPGRGGARRRARDSTSKPRISRSSRSTRQVNFEAVRRAALPLLPVLLARWLPNGRRVGREYLALNPKRADRNLGSFKIVVAGPRMGMWADFATGDKGGDVISLAAYLFDLSQTAAARRVVNMLGVSS
jgi:hypothetical protein